MKQGSFDEIAGRLSESGGVSDLPQQETELRGCAPRQAWHFRGIPLGHGLMQTSSTLRIASYNIQKCVGLDFRRQPQRILQVIENTKADIVVLQEADKRLPPRPLREIGANAVLRWREWRARGE